MSMTAVCVAAINPKLLSGTSLAGYAIYTSRPWADLEHANMLLQRKWTVERIPVDLEPIPGFNLRAQIVGHGGAYVKHIQQETGCRVQIKGRGSGYLEVATNREGDEDMHLSVT